MDRYRAGNRRWTPDDDALLRRVYPSEPTAVIARRLRRSPAAVSTHAGVLHLHKRAACFRPSERKPMTDPQQARFEGWAIVDVMGHQRYVGYVTTEAYGQAVLFRIDVPALDARERVTKRPGHYGDRGYLPAGTTVKEGAVAGYSKLVGSGSIYTITPCTKEAALEAVEAMQARPLMSVEIPAGLALPAQTRDPDDYEDDPSDEADMDDPDRDEDLPV